MSGHDPSDLVRARAAVPFDERRQDDETSRLGKPELDEREPRGIVAACMHEAQPFGHELRRLGPREQGAELSGRVAKGGAGARAGKERARRAEKRLELTAPRLSCALARRGTARARE